MTKLAPILLAVVALAIAFSFSGAVFVVDEVEQVIITQFGEPVGEAINTPGVHYKLPFVQVATRFDKRFLEWNGDPNEIPTKDKRFVHIDAYARWRIVDPLLFFQRVRDERGAQSRLDDILDGEVRNAIAKHVLVEIVRSTTRDVPIDTTLTEEERPDVLMDIELGRLGIMAEILEGAQGRATDLGIEILDVRFKGINYNKTVQKTVFDRMITERKRVAERFRSEGEGEAAKILGEKERRLKEIESGAYKEAQGIIGRADASSTSIYAAAYNADPDFYEFLKTMETYPATIDANTWLVLSSDSDFMRYLKSPDR